MIDNQKVGSGPIKVAKVGDLKPGEGHIVLVDEKELALFNVDGEFYAVDNLCRHEGGPIGDGDLEDNIVTCPMHGWLYDVVTGTFVGDPTGEFQTDPKLNLKTYKVVIENKEVKVLL
ncbi:MAG: Rieske (2Fe-2S) protein [Nitrososphaerales archaeon]